MRGSGDVGDKVTVTYAAAGLPWTVPGSLVLSGVSGSFSVLSWSLSRSPLLSELLIEINGASEEASWGSEL